MIIFYYLSYSLW